MDDHQHQNHPPHAGQSINQYAQDMRGPSMGGPSTNTSLTQAQHIAASQQQHIISFWNRQKQQIRDSDLDLKSHSLPLARIKKVMKSDEDSKNLMIASEAPILFSKACEIFIEELTTRAWMQAEESKRRTLQKQDISNAISRSDMYDFLIDIVPRDSEPPYKPKANEFYNDSNQYQYAYPNMGISNFTNNGSPNGEAGEFYAEDNRPLE